MVDPDELRENLIVTLQRVDERTEAEEEAETLALLAEPQHMHMAEPNWSAPCRATATAARRSGTDGGTRQRYHHPAGAAAARRRPNPPI